MLKTYRDPEKKQETGKENLVYTRQLVHQHHFLHIVGRYTEDKAVDRASNLTNQY